ncbi:MAG: iron ABC transporter permease [Ignavibacteria bacterium]|nr:iron ABC transporter permease [Ignavibacteria bacterium]
MNLLKKVKYRTIYLSLGILLFLLIILSTRVGAVNISYDQIFDFFLDALGKKPNGEINPVIEGLFFQIRLPRTFMCFIVGAALSVSGALMQSLFRNPIVEPGLVGTSAGSALGASLMFVFGKSALFAGVAFLGDLMLPVSAFIGGLIATIIVYKFSSYFGKVNVATMILAGIAVNAMAAGGTGFLSYIARDPQARSITFWNLGTFSGADWKSVVIVSVSTAICFSLTLRYSKQLNALQLGETEAGYLGFNVERMKIQLILINTLMVSVATSMVGVISFVGLTVPHLLRLMKGSDNRYLIIGSGLLGAIVMIIADMLARVIIAPAEMPIGIITAFVGAPVFLFLLYKNRKSHGKGGFLA